MPDSTEIDLPSAKVAQLEALIEGLREHAREQSESIAELRGMLVQALEQRDEARQWNF